jgi:hypothetical protein
MGPIKDGNKIPSKVEESHIGNPRTERKGHGKRPWYKRG